MSPKHPSKSDFGELAVMQSVYRREDALTSENLYPDKSIFHRIKDSPPFCRSQVLKGLLRIGNGSRHATVKVVNRYAGYAAGTKQAQKTCPQTRQRCRIWGQTRFPAFY